MSSIMQKALTADAAAPVRDRRDGAAGARRRGSQSHGEAAGRPFRERRRIRRRAEGGARRRRPAAGRGRPDADPAVDGHHLGDASRGGRPEAADPAVRPAAGAIGGDAEGIAAPCARGRGRGGAAASGRRRMVPDASSGNAARSDGGCSRDRGSDRDPDCADPGRPRPPPLQCRLLPRPTASAPSGPAPSGPAPTAAEQSAATTPTGPSAGATVPAAPAAVPPTKTAEATPVRETPAPTAVKPQSPPAAPQAAADATPPPAPAPATAPVTTPIPAPAPRATTTAPVATAAREDGTRGNTDTGHDTRRHGETGDAASVSGSAAAGTPAACDDDPAGTPAAARTRHRPPHPLAPRSTPRSRRCPARWSPPRSNRATP